MKNLRYLKRLLTNAAVITAFLGALTPAMAADDPISLKAAIDSLRAEVVSRMDTFKTKFLELFEKAASEAGIKLELDLATRSQHPNLATLNPDKAYTFTDGSKANEGLANVTVPVRDMIESSVQRSVADKLNVVLANKDSDSQRQILLSPTDKTADSIADLTKMLDPQNILWPLAYTKIEEQNRAERSVAYLSDYASPLGSIDLVALEASKEKDSPAAQIYKVKVYTNAALRALFLGNLYQSFNSRIPVKNLGKTVGIPGKDDASLAEVEKYIASRRLNDPQWHKNINEASPVALEREILVVLTEIQQQLYQNHRDNERLLQTLTAVGVANLRSSSNVSDKNEVELKQAVEGTTLKPDEIPGVPTVNNTNPQK